MRAFTACADCGSLLLRGVKAIGGIAGVPGLQPEVQHCPACGWEGVALEFGSEDAWRAFVEARAADRAERHAHSS